MAKTLLDLDESLLAEAQDALQTSTKKDTVTAALREVLESRRRAAAVLAEMSRAKSGGYEFLVSDENDAWR
jgi:Arc/MetJ family transcription regulator